MASLIPRHSLNSQPGKRIPLGVQRLRNWTVPLLITFVAVILQMTAAPQSLRLESSLAFAEPWRLLSAHFVHLGWGHLWLNLGGLGLLWLLLGDTLKPLWWASGVVVLAFGVSLALLSCSPAVEWYVGFSGVLHGLFVAGAIANLWRLTPLALSILAVLLVKLVVEWAAEGDPLTAGLIGGAVIVDAHLYGVFLGACYGALSFPTLSRSFAR
jgi:rhomboid family GlyGly-CTERM serine protease